MIRTLCILLMFAASTIKAAETEAETEVKDETEIKVETETERKEVEVTTNKTEATEANATQPRINTNLVLGMNVRGNKESPLSLTIVPWRSAEHSIKDPEIMAAWRPELGLLQPEAYRRNINAFLKSRRMLTLDNASGIKNEN